MLSLPRNDAQRDRARCLVSLMSGIAMQLRVLLLLLVITSAFAQTGQVRGRVTETGDSTYAVIGAYVKLLQGQRGSSIGALDGS